MTGSSPLARGLRAVVPDGSGRRRIIPARAGFTSSPTPTPTGTWDHPRSRGVYSGSVGVQERGAGSSPLARGLRRVRVGHPPRGGIIPARAGFTCRSGCRRAGAADHPRSRGVYLDAGKLLGVYHGSSPLARGLPPPVDAGDVPVGIIPARAGFTTRVQMHFPSTSDHPRSRGVYALRMRWRIARAGSSPLARGLRPESRRPGGDPGIIPARAGFTPLPG